MKCLGEKNPPGDLRSVPRVFFIRSEIGKKISKNTRVEKKGPSSAVENRPLGPRSWISFILTARHANLMNGFAGACLRRIRESRDLSISHGPPRESHEWIRGGVPSEKWIDLRSGAPAIFDGRRGSPPIPGPLRFLWNLRGRSFFRFACFTRSFRAPISDRCPEGTSKTRGKSS